MPVFSTAAVVSQFEMRRAVVSWLIGVHVMLGVKELSPQAEITALIMLI